MAGGGGGAGFPGCLQPPHPETGGCRQPQVIGQAGRLSRLLGDLSARFRERGPAGLLPLITEAEVLEKPQRGPKLALFLGVVLGWCGRV